MVQLLLILNLIVAALSLFAVGALFYSLKRVVERVEELEAEYLKAISRISELKTNVEKLESSLEFLQNQVKILLTGTGRKE